MKMTISTSSIAKIVKSENPTIMLPYVYLNEYEETG